MIAGLGGVDTLGANWTQGRCRTLAVANDQESRPGETVRETIVRSIRESEAAMAKSAPPSVNLQALADKAVLGLCETLALLFGLPFGEDLYNDKSVTGWHLSYLAIGLLFAVAGPLWPWIRTRAWLPANVSASLSRAALDARIWIAALLLLFIYGTGPEIYRRATEPIRQTEQPHTTSNVTPTGPSKPLIPPGDTIISDLQLTKEVENLRSRVDDLTRQRDVAAAEARDLKARSSSSPTPLTFGPLKALALAKAVGSIPDRWAVYFTYAPENKPIADLLIGLMRDRLNPWILDPPDSSTDLDARECSTA